MTPQQAKTLTFIRQYIASNNGVSPTYTEIQEHLGLASKSGIHAIIRALQEQGQLTARSRKARSIVLAGSAERQSHLQQLSEALASLVDRDLVFDGNCIVIRLDTYGQALEVASRARAALARVREAAP